ncbi:MAG: glutamate--tRNA ligase [Simkaniaceae bacterium]|nr:glutamate--tRNA ligase [Simkaniaceae bacterium]
MMPEEVRTRIAPSPTGEPHVGTPYMALFNLVFARHHGGKCILRIEDTDRTRSRKEYETSIIEALRWLGIGWDEGPDIGGPYGPYRQSERGAIYRKHAQILLDVKKAYKCFATPEELREMREVAGKAGKPSGYDRRYRNLSEEETAVREAKGEPYVIRLKVPLTGTCEYDDMVKGKISCPWADVDDQVLLKSDGFPTYHLANVVDDRLMAISHVIRGDEWMSSTPKHMFLYDSFGWSRPKVMHMPLLLGPGGKKLSKRNNPTAVFYYKECGYLPEAFVNFLTLMGYGMEGEREIYSVDELIRTFSVKRVGSSGAFFDSAKLDWINQHYLIHTIPEGELWPRIREWGFSDEKMERLMPLVRTRIKTFGSFMDLCSFLFTARVSLSEELLRPKGISKEASAAICRSMIRSMDEGGDWGRTGFEQGSREVAKVFGVNHKKIVMPILFVAITGSRYGPPLFDSVDILGKNLTRARLLEAIAFLGGLSNKLSSALDKGWASGDCSFFSAKG